MLYDAETGEEILFEGSDSRIWRGPEFTPDLVRSHAQRKRPAIIASDERAYRVMLPVKEAGVTRIVGLASLTRFARDDHEMEQEVSTS